MPRPPKRVGVQEDYDRLPIIFPRVTARRSWVSMIALYSMVGEIVRETDHKCCFTCLSFVLAYIIQYMDMTAPTFYHVRTHSFLVLHRRSHPTSFPGRRREYFHGYTSRR